MAWLRHRAEGELQLLRRSSKAVELNAVHTSHNDWRIRGPLAPKAVRFVEKNDRIQSRFIGGIVSGNSDFDDVKCKVKQSEGD